MGRRAAKQEGWVSLCIDVAILAHCMPALASPPTMLTAGVSPVGPSAPASFWRSVAASAFRPSASAFSFAASALTAASSSPSPPAAGVVAPANCCRSAAASLHRRSSSAASAVGPRLPCGCG